MLHSQQAGTLQCSSQCRQCSQSSAGPVQGCQREVGGGNQRRGVKVPAAQMEMSVVGRGEEGEGGGKEGEGAGGQRW